MALSLDAEAQCAMCRRIAESNLNEGTTAVSRNLNDAIIYLMTIPYIVLGGLGYLFYKNLKQKRIEDKAIWIINWLYFLRFDKIIYLHNLYNTSLCSKS